MFIKRSKMTKLIKMSKLFDFLETFDHFRSVSTYFQLNLTNFRYILNSSIKALSNSINFVAIIKNPAPDLSQIFN